MHEMFKGLRRLRALILLAAATGAMTPLASAAATNQAAVCAAIQSPGALRNHVSLLGSELRAIRAEENEQVVTDLTMWRAYRALSAKGETPEAKALLARINLGSAKYMALARREAAIQAQINLLSASFAGVHK